MALHYAGIAVEMREISLKEKPAHMLQVSPKGTVPVLVLPDGKVIDQSLDIMRWAIQQRDPDGWLHADMEKVEWLIAQNDGPFKQKLDRYKYAIRFPEHPAEYYRSQGELFLAELERCLHDGAFLAGPQLSLADVAIFPFVRQFAAVDADWFVHAGYSGVNLWLKQLVESALFNAVMAKYPLYLDQG